jgi:lipocalin
MPSAKEWIKKSVVHICIMAYYSVIKNNEIMSFAGKWMELEREDHRIQQIVSY